MIIDNLDALLDATSEALSVSVDAITGSSRQKMPSLARQIVMALWSEGHSLQEAADVVNRKSHTLVYYARLRMFEGEQNQNRLQKVLEIYEKKARTEQKEAQFLVTLAGVESPFNPLTETTNNKNK